MLRYRRGLSMRSGWGRFWPVKNEKATPRWVEGVQAFHGRPQRPGQHREQTKGKNYAAVVELVDTPALGAGPRKRMRVRVSPAAPTQTPSAYRRGLC